MSGIKMGDAYVSISCDNKRLKEGLKESKAAVDGFSKLGAVNITVGAAGAAYAIKQLTELQDKILTLQGVTGKSAQAVAALEAQAKKLGAATSWTAGEVAGGMIELARMGQTCEQVSASIEPVMNLAKGLGVSVADSAGMLGSVLNQFKMDASQSAKVSDVLAKATNSAAISSTELGISLKYAGTSGAQMGQSLENTTALIMALRNVGYDAEQAGTVVRSFFLSLNDPKKAGALEKLFNVNLRTAEGNFRPILAILEDVKKAADQMGPALQENLMAAGIEKAAVGGVAELIGSVDKLKDFSDSLKECDGYSQKLSKTMESGLTGSIQLMKSAADGLAITIGETLASDFTVFIDAITNTATAAAAFVKDNAELIKSVSKSAAVFSALSMGAAGAVKVFSSVSGAFTSARGSLSRLLEAFKPRPIEDTAGRVGALQVSLDALKKKTTETAEAVKRANEALRASKLSGDTKAINEATKSLEAQKRALEALKSQTAKTSAEMRALNAQTKAAGSGFKSAGASLKSFLKAGAEMAAISAIIAEITELTRACVEWSARQASKMRAAADEAERYRDALKESSAQTGTRSGVEAQASDIEETLRGAFNRSDLTDKERAANDAKLERMTEAGLITAEQMAAIQSGSATAEQQREIRRGALSGFFERNRAAAEDNAAASEKAFSSELMGALGLSGVDSKAVGDVAALITKDVENIAAKTGKADFRTLSADLQKSGKGDDWEAIRKSWVSSGASKNMSVDQYAEQLFYFKKLQNQLDFVKREAASIASRSDLTDAEKEQKTAEITGLARSKVAEVKADAFKFGAGTMFEGSGSKALRQSLEAVAGLFSDEIESAAKKPLEDIRIKQYEADTLREFTEPLTEPTAGPTEPTAEQTTDVTDETADDVGEAAEVIDEAADSIAEAADDFNDSEGEWRRDFSAALERFSASPNMDDATKLKELIKTALDNGYDVADVRAELERDSKRTADKMSGIIGGMRMTLSSQSKVFDSFSGAHSAAPSVSLQSQQIERMTEFINQSRAQLSELKGLSDQQTQIIKLLK